MRKLISRNTMLSEMGASLEGTTKAISHRAARISMANGFTEYTKPGQMGIWYDKAEVDVAKQGKPLPPRVKA